MQIAASREFGTWLAEIQRVEGQARVWVLALLSYLRELPERPEEETATLKRVRQARRYEIWRLAHPFDPEVAIRILCWFPDRVTAVVTLVGGDKANIGDVWYGSATPRAEAAVDQWHREHLEEQQ
jgi:hypothetical protein